jgi:signal recognition particle receptor subunit beta
MVLFNYSTKELTAKVVYYGPGLCGKTTNLQWIHEKLPIRNKGKMLSLATEADRTLFFDFLPIELGTIRGMKTRVQLYTVPGQVFYNATRRMVLKGADCVVFVADSQEPMLDANLDAMANLRENLEVNEIDPDEIPMVLQYNKRDLPNALPTEILDERLNPRGLPFYEAVAMKGQGVEDTLKGATALVFKSLAGRYGGTEATAVPAAAAAALNSPGTTGATPAPGAVTPASPFTPPAPAPARPASPPPAAPVPPPRAAAPTRIVPSPPVPGRMPTPGTATLPPLNLESGGQSEDLLESLELQPPDAMEESELQLDPSGPGEELVIEDVPSPPPPPLNGPSRTAPQPVPPPVMAPPRTPGSPPVGKTTLVSRPDEAEELRRKIGRRLEPDMVLEEVDEDEEDIEEITFDSPGTPRDFKTDPTTSPKMKAPVFPMTAPVPPPLPPAAPLRSPEPSFSWEAERPAEPAFSLPPPIPAAAARPPIPLGKTTATPVPVEVTVRQGETDVVVPVEVTVHHGAAQVNLHLQLTLKVRIVD